MRLDLKLPDLPRLSLSDALLRRPLAELSKIKTRNEERWGEDSGSGAFENRKEKLRKRLQGAVSPRKELEKIKVTEVGWQRLLLSLYIESNGQDWLPAFDDGIASAVLGGDGVSWTASRRRQAVQLFFERFDTLPALSYLATQLRSAFDSRSTANGAKDTAWKRHRKELFQTDGHGKVAQTAKNGETLQQLMERCAVPTKGVFSVRLRQVFLLESLQQCTLGDEPDVLHEIEKEREKTSIDSLLLGAAALRIMVSRVESESRRQWPEKWRKWLVRLGCDPRMGRHTAEGTRWWGWATNSQWNLAVQGIIGLSLKIFFDFLDGTVSVHQWEERRQFLEACFDAGKIIDARLVLNDHCMQRLPVKMRDKWSTASLNSTTEDTCIIALRCTDDIYLLEGTHSYALRAFHRTFPVKGFWERNRQQYADSELRIAPSLCPVFIRHQGLWIKKFQHSLASQFHVEWDDTRQNASSIPRSLEYNSSPAVKPQLTGNESDGEIDIPLSNFNQASSSPAQKTDCNSALNVLLTSKATVELYLGHLRKHLNSKGSVEHFAHRESLLLGLITKRKVKEARVKTNSEGRHFLLLRCTDNMLLADATHYGNLRGTRMHPGLWDILVNEPSKDWSKVLRNQDFELRVNHTPIDGYIKRFCESLATHCGVIWTDLTI